MAFTAVPNEALDRMTELSAGALRLYLFLLRCRNQATGKCCPSVRVTAEAIDVHPKNIFKLRNELAAAGWARFNGDSAAELLGVKSSKNATVHVEIIKDTSDSSKNATPESQKRYSMVAKTLLDGSKNATAYKEEQYEGTRLKNNTKKDMSGAVAPAVSSPVLEVFTYWQAVLNHPQSKLTPERKKKVQARLDQGYTVAQIQTAIDGCRASPFHMGQNDSGTVYDDLTLICRNGDKLEFFISRSNSSGRNQIPRNETHNERAAREMEELFRRSAAVNASADGDNGADKPDSGETWIAADYTRL